MPKIKFLSYTFLLCCSFCFKISAQFISDISIVPLEFRAETAETKHPVLRSDKDSKIYSYHTHIHVHKSLRNQIDLFSGIGYTQSSGNFPIDVDIASFFQKTNIEIGSIPMEDSDLEIKKATYVDKYLSVPIGFRLYSSVKGARKFRMTLSTGVDFSFLLQSDIGVRVSHSEFVNVLGEIIQVSVDKRIYGTIYESKAKAFFEESSKDFLMNTRIGIGYDWQGKKKFGFGNEIVFYHFLNEHKEGLLKRKIASGIVMFRFMFRF